MAAFNDTVEEILIEREHTHGHFVSQAATAHGLKTAYRNGQHWNYLLPAQKEALDHIAVKISRIINGDANFLDHWKDIAGYSRLVMQSIEDEQNDISENIIICETNFKEV